MDAFAAALSLGARVHPTSILGRALGVGLAFGVAQGVMPLLGWSLGVAFNPVIREWDHWVAFVLLGFMGARMMREGLTTPSEAQVPDRSVAPVSGGALLVVAVATSIDAAVAGVTLPFLGQPVLLACAVIGGITLAMSIVGVLLGKTVGMLAGRRAEVIGGALLIAIGSKILIEHVFYGG